MQVAALSRLEQKQQTRDVILGTALRLFVEHGVLATRTSDIAEAAGISHGSIFAHFHTRDALIAATVEQVARKIATRVRRDTADCATTREVLSAHLTSIAAHEDIYVRLLTEAPFLPPDARRALVEIQSAISSRLEEAWRLDVSRGRVRRMSPDLAFNTWIGLLHHYLANRDLFAPGQSLIGTWGRRLLNHYCALMAPPKSRR